MEARRVVLDLREMSSLEAIKFNKDECSLLVLDQLLLPFQEKYIQINSTVDAYEAIKKMQVRGAPAIAIVGVLSMAVELHNVFKQNAVTQFFYDTTEVDKVRQTLAHRVEYLVLSRPTAVNLSKLTSEVMKSIESEQTPQLLYRKVVDEAHLYFTQDLENNHKIGAHGADFILDSLAKQNFEGPFSVMTICNTGSLATSGYGTALGVIRELWQRSKKESPKKKTGAEKDKTAWLEMVFPLETRPYNQGSRLTAYELKYESIPTTLITDNMVSFLLDSIESGRVSQPPVKAIIVGADRIALNGDTANKIGTLQLAKLASLYKDILFIVAAPVDTIDRCESGKDIIVEERPSDELKKVKGGVKNEDGSYSICVVDVAPAGVSVWNPSFDITNHEWIDAIVTEKGVIQKNNGTFYPLLK